MDPSKLARTHIRTHTHTQREGGVGSWVLVGGWIFRQRGTFIYCILYLFINAYLLFMQQVINYIGGRARCCCLCWCCCYCCCCARVCCEFSLGFLLAENVYKLFLARATHSVAAVAERQATRKQLAKVAPSRKFSS